MQRAMLVTVKIEYDKSTWDVVEQEHELRELAITAGLVVAKENICHRDGPTANLYVGEGKVEELAQIVQDEKIGCVIFNNELSGTQHKNLENALGVKVIDRTQLMLDIFSKHARSPEGKAQVELAQLEYLLPRLSGKGTELSRLGGGVGTRGPGEQKLEEDRRRIREKILRLKKDLKDLTLRRKTLKTRREESSLPTVAFVGYTSAGKSTLFNTLTGSEQTVSKGLFTTLDPLARAFTLANHQKIVFSDTVGFIRHLPHHLIDAFKATLEEAVEADLLIHVLDISSSRAKDHYQSVEEVLEDLGAADKKTILALNKIDLIEDEGQIRRFLKSYPESVAISALKAENLDLLLSKVQEHLSDYLQDVSLIIPSKRMDLLNSIYHEGEVREVTYKPDGIYIKALLPVMFARRLRKFFIRLR